MDGAGEVHLAFSEQEIEVAAEAEGWLLAEAWRRWEIQVAVLELDVEDLGDKGAHFGSGGEAVRTTGQVEVGGIVDDAQSGVID